MSNSLTPQMYAQIFAQESNTPFLTLVTLSHPSFSTIYLVNNNENIVSRGNTYIAFPMRIKLPVDDGETTKDVGIEFDNVSLDLINSIRSVTTAINVKLEMILSTIPDTVQLSLEDLLITSLSYNKNRVIAKLIIDGFLNIEMTSEKYFPNNFPGIF